MAGYYDNIRPFGFSSFPAPSYYLQINKNDTFTIHLPECLRGEANDWP